MAESAIRARQAKGIMFSGMNRRTKEEKEEKKNDHRRPVIHPGWVHPSLFNPSPISQSIQRILFTAGDDEPHP
jgi:hypothetical protein